MAETGLRGREKAAELTSKRKSAEIFGHHEGWRTECAHPSTAEDTRAAQLARAEPDTAPNTGRLVELTTHRIVEVNDDQLHHSRRY
jgi:hypothetical protein